ncbi:hypothetical protein H4582DRAFT_2024044 [Lactarius indigo]|nr:hypothetical protein H4582DRAFT_2024044 [Lactarius indigo]
MYTYSSFLSPELPQLAEVQATGSTTRHRPNPGLVDSIPTSTQSSLPSGAAMESRLAPPLLNPILRFPSSQTLAEGVETTKQEQDMQEAGGTKAVGTLTNSIPAEVVSVPPTSVTERWPRVFQSRLAPHPEAVMISRNPFESVLSSTPDFPLSSATSLRTAMGPLSP